MTESELIEAITSYQDVSLSATALYLTILSGYLITAYVAGKNLSGTQLVIINFLFFFSSAMAASGSVFYTARTVVYSARLEQLVSKVTDTGPDIVSKAWGCVLALGMLSAFYFMWSIRRR